MKAENEEKMKTLIGKKVSILLDDHKIENGKKRESYVEIVKEIENGTLILNMQLKENPTFYLKEVWFDIGMICSIWVYKKV